jgi:hypothetical protein
MHEHISTTIFRLDEAVTFGAIEPLNRTDGHLTLLEIELESSCL